MIFTRLRHPRSSTVPLNVMLAEGVEETEVVIVDMEPEREKALCKSIGAALSLGEATAEAVARIPDAHCNGDMHAALEYARQIKHEQKDFLTQQGIEAIF